MGNGESSYDNSPDDFHQQPPPSHAGIPRDLSSSSSCYHQSFDHHQQPRTFPESSMDSRTKHRSRIADNFNSLDEVVSALREAGLESSNLILGIDFTKSNEWTGKHSFHSKSLHSISSNTPNPYEQAISIIGRTWSPFVEDNLIPCFGFGDASTHDRDVFSFYPDHRPCHGFAEALARYKEIVPYLNLSGPTSFAPIINASIDIVERSNGQYHVLVIIADGQVTRDPNTPPGRLSPQEQATVNSIVAASQYPLSIILVGVGDGPWDSMQQFDDNIPQRAFDNFQFVNFTKIMSENTDPSKKETAFALAALMEIPLQYKATLTLNNQEHVGHTRVGPLPPPKKVVDHDNLVNSIPRPIPLPTTEATPSESASVEPVCPICRTSPRDMAFGCGHTVVSALREAGLESSNLILGIDFTKSNEWTGKHSFHRKSLHSISSSTPNPYEQAISIIGRTLSPFDEDNLIPCFGFGDASTHDRDVFSFYPDHRPCHGFAEALARYKEIAPYLNLSGPTSFAPIIDASIDIVERSNGQYHVLVIIADGQVTRDSNTPPGRLSPQEQATVNSIVAASRYPLSIILVGVGDGPWDSMQQFDDNIPQRAFDNFQFVNFTKIMSENTDPSKKETAFALAALMEIPFQFKATLTLNNQEHVGHTRIRPLPPPKKVVDHDNLVNSIPRPIPLPTTEATPSESASVEPVCPICLVNPRDMAFGCGHTTCKDCGATISTCPLCRQPIFTRIRLYI